MFIASKVRENSYNKRLWINEETVLRGAIYDRNDNILAYSDKDGDRQTRHYKYGNTYSHLIGYSYKQYGKSGLEATYNNELLNLDNNNPLKQIRKMITDQDEVGNNLILTVDHEIQKRSQELLGKRNGAIVVMNPISGEIYAMVSNPGFNPSTLSKYWSDIVENPDSPLLNRATSGLYTPGSVFKIITTTAAIEKENIKTEYECDGYIDINGYVLKDYRGIAHGQTDLEKALVESCNIAFSQIGIQLGQEALKDTSEKFMLNKVIPFDLKTGISSFPTRGKLNKPELGASAIGQGKLLVTPLNMAMVTSAIANNGMMVKPILVKKVVTPKGKTVKENEIEVLSEVTDSAIANQIKEMMVKVVTQGTGTKAQIKNIRVAGKTGTAENETGKDHAWFVGFAPADQPQVAVAVILENSGTTGGTSAAPIARDIIKLALKRLK